jgi:hypothetical protein
VQAAGDSLTSLDSATRLSCHLRNSSFCSMDNKGKFPIKGCSAFIHR